MTRVNPQSPMLGVLANEQSRPLAEEFFQLFKTPWEFAHADRAYDVLLVTDGEAIPETPAKLVFLYGAQPIPWDHSHGCSLTKEPLPAIVQSADGPLALHAGCGTFETEDGVALMKHDETARPCALEIENKDTKFVRVGYDLFEEVRLLLTEGQPPTHGAYASLDLHIAFLRNRMIASGIAFAEIPPVPAGHAFTVCLSHDVDHPRLRFHGLDHTLAGFLARATFGSIKRLFRGRLPVSGLLKNWLSVVSLPLVYLRWIRDPWDAFSRYTAIEAGLPSTFFVIPFAGRPGRDASGAVRGKRASRYGAQAIRADLEDLVEAGKEVSLHGIDAWRDASSGREEVSEVAGFKRGDERGVRMHWLYFGPDSPRLLEEAGFTYDSTVGFNETVGLRAGTFQAYLAPGTDRLLEMPLHVMDTALFYPDYLDLTPGQARERVLALGRKVKRLGGALTVNWHDRSLAPERLWGELYRELVEVWKGEQAWLTSLEQAVAWFRWRRSFRFERESEDRALTETCAVVGDPPARDDLPDVVLRIYQPDTPDDKQTKKYVDYPFAGKRRMKIPPAPREAAVA